MIRRKIAGLIILVMILVILGVVFCTSFIKSKPVLRFSVERCSDLNINPYSPPHEGILNKTWMDGSTLVVEAYVKTFCGGATITGDYALEGDNLILKYRVKAEGPVTRCNCVHKVVYEISNLERRNYSISIIREEI